MDTMVFFHKDKKPKDWQEEWSLPMGFFECGKLQRGDTIELHMLIGDEPTQGFTVQVVRAEIDLAYKPWINDHDLIITQWAYVKG